MKNNIKIGCIVAVTFFIAFAIGFHSGKGQSTKEYIRVQKPAISNGFESDPNFARNLITQCVNQAGYTLSIYGRRNTYVDMGTFNEQTGQKILYIESGQRF